jgi:hypothetical protein
LEAEYLSFDEALLASDNFFGHSTPDKIFKRGILAGLSHAPRRAPCCHYTPTWPYAVAGAQRDGDFRVGDGSAGIGPMRGGVMGNKSAGLRLLPRMLERTADLQNRSALPASACPLSLVSWYLTPGTGNPLSALVIALAG